MNFYSWLFASRSVVSRRPRLPRGVACDADAPSAPTSPFTSDGARRHIDGSRCYKPAGEPCRRDQELIAICSAFAEKEDDFGSMPMLTKKPKEDETPEERAVREYNEVVARYTDKNGKRKKGWLKAPNGKPTNLEEYQWVMVRTPSFKAWFGDWENDPANASKVVDENGEPMPVYHGTNADFTTFDIDGACGGAAYFAFDRDYVREHYGQGVKECFLDVRKPIGEDEMYDRYGVDFSSLNEQEIDATRQAVNKVRSDGYDGVIGTTFDSESNEKKAIAVFLASQIASANRHFGMTNE